MKTNLTRMIVITAATMFVTAGTLSAQNDFYRPKTETERQQTLAGKAARLTKLAQMARIQDAGEPTATSPFSNVLVSQITRRPVTWTLDGATCSMLKLKLTAKGDGKSTLTVLQNRDGSLNYEMKDEVNGTATDEKGGQYIFIYSLTNVFDSSAIFPAPLEPHAFKGPDVFQLIGVTPGAPSYTVNIFFDAIINADGSFTDLATMASADPNCDPI